MGPGGNQALISHAQRAPPPGPPSPRGEGRSPGCGPGMVGGRRPCGLCSFFPSRWARLQRIRRVDGPDRTGTQGGSVLVSFHDSSLMILIPLPPFRPAVRERAAGDGAKMRPVPLRTQCRRDSSVSAWWTGGTDLQLTYSNDGDEGYNLSGGMLPLL